MTTSLPELIEDRCRLWGVPDGPAPEVQDEWQLSPIGVIEAPPE